jgi:hypothetical protein
MNTGLNKAITSAVSVANLIADALLSPVVALELVRQPQQVAAERGLDMQSVLASSRIVEKGESISFNGYWY